MKISLTVALVVIVAVVAGQAAPRILVFSGWVGFRHESIPDGAAAIKAIGARKGWTVDEGAETSAFSEGNLRKYDAVVWNNSCGNDDGKELLTGPQKAAFEAYLRSGKGSVGIHCSSCAGTAGPGEWTWYNDMIGAVNTGHPTGALQFQTAEIVIEDRAHPSTRGLPAVWKLKDEWFHYDRSPRPGADILLSLDESSYQPGKAMGDHPIAWTRYYKGGRVFYTGIGHMREVWSDTNYLKHLEGGILWAAGFPDSLPAGPAVAANGLLLDLDAEKGVSLEDGDRVAGWSNQAPGGKAREFVKNDGGRAVPGSGRPTLRRSVPALMGHHAVSFKSQDLLSGDENAFDSLILGKGYTWFAVLSASAQVVGEPNVNSFFGNLRNGGQYEGMWGGMDDDRTLWCGSRNGASFGRWNADNPKVAGPMLETGTFNILAGRMGAGTGKVPIELFVNRSGAPLARETFPVNPSANPSKMAIGTERDASNHPGHESFDGEIARFLIYERPLSDTEVVGTFEALRRTYFMPPVGLVMGGKGRRAPPSSALRQGFDLKGRAIIKGAGH